MGEFNAPEFQTCIHWITYLDLKRMHGLRLGLINFCCSHFLPFQLVFWTPSSMSSAFKMLQYGWRSTYMIITNKHIISLLQITVQQTIKPVKFPPIRQSTRTYIANPTKKLFARLYHSFQSDAWILVMSHLLTLLNRIGLQVHKTPKLTLLNSISYCLWG